MDEKYCHVHGCVWQCDSLVRCGEVDAARLTRRAASCPRTAAPRSARRRGCPAWLCSPSPRTTPASTLSAWKTSTARTTTLRLSPWKVSEWCTRDQPHVLMVQQQHEEKRRIVQPQPLPSIASMEYRRFLCSGFVAVWEFPPGCLGGCKLRVGSGRVGSARRGAGTRSDARHSELR